MPQSDRLREEMGGKDAFPNCMRTPGISFSLFLTVLRVGVLIPTSQKGSWHCEWLRDLPVDGALGPET